MHAIGIDMSKRSFHAAFGSETIREFKNDSDGFALFLEAAKSLGHHQQETTIGVEATGAYHLAFCAALTKQGWRTVIMNPLESHRFALSQSIRNVKNDRKDAELVRRMVLLGRGCPFRDTDETIALKSLVAEREALVSMRRILKQRAEASTARQQAVTKALHDSSAPILKVLSKEIRTIERRFGGHAPDIQRLLQTIPGIGIVAAATLVAYVGDINWFPSPEKLTAFIGLDCRTFESGTSIKGKGYISKKGNGNLRKALWNSAFIARRKNPDLKSYFEKKIGEGKHYCVALCAVERKLVHLIYAVWKRGTPFENRCA